MAGCLCWKGAGALASRLKTTECAARKRLFTLGSERELGV